MPHCLRVCQSKSAAVYHLENSVFFVRIPHVPPSLPLSPPTYRTTRGENLGQALYRNRLPHCSFNPTKITFQVAGPFPFLQLYLISPHPPHVNEKKSSSFRVQVTAVPTHSWFPPCFFCLFMVSLQNNGSQNIQSITQFWWVVLT
jgi:hypothetical protein